jgi:hypothetical protein
VASTSKKEGKAVKRMILLVNLLILFGLSHPVLAQEHFFDSGFYVGLGPNASFMNRQKNINYGFSGAPTSISPLSGTEIRDVAVSPALTLGYKITPADSVSLRGDWAHYSVSRGLTTDCGLAVAPIDGSSGASFTAVTCFPPGVPLLPTAVNLDWKSDVSNVELEYQRLLWSDNLGGALGLLGFKYRFERQQFNADSGFLPDGLIFPTFTPFDAVEERLSEHLYGPYAGIKLSFKPMAESNVNISVKTNVGFLFKSAHLRGREVLDPTGFLFLGPSALRQNDSSSKGTAFTNAGLDVIYSITKNWHLGAGYQFHWINKVAHIFNTKVDAAIPSRIENSAVLTHNLGLKVIYKF